MCLPVAVYYEPWNKGKPPKMPLKPSEKLAAAFPYLCFILVVMGMSSAIYHESHHPMSDEVIVEDLSYYQTGPYLPFVNAGSYDTVLQLSPGATAYTLTTADGQVSTGYVSKESYAGEVWA